MAQNVERVIQRPEPGADGIEVKPFHCHDQQQNGLVPQQQVSESVFIRVHPDRKSTRLNSSHPSISYAVFCLKKKKKRNTTRITTTKPTSRTRIQTRNYNLNTL